MNFRRLLCLLGALLLGTGIYAQNRLTAVLIDESNGEPVGFATVSLTKEGAQKPAKYVLSDSEGKVELTGVRAGTYTFRRNCSATRPSKRKSRFPTSRIWAKSG